MVRDMNHRICHQIALIHSYFGIKTDELPAFHEFIVQRRRHFKAFTCIRVRQLKRMGMQVQPLGHPDRKLSRPLCIFHRREWGYP